MNKIQLDYFQAAYDEAEGVFYLEAIFDKKADRINLPSNALPTTSSCHTDFPDNYHPLTNCVHFKQKVDFDIMQHMPESDLFDWVFSHKMEEEGRHVRRFVVNSLDINDTRYPPPYATRGGAIFGPNDPTDKLKIKVIKVERVGTDRFNIDITMVPSSASDFTVGDNGTCYIHTDLYNYANDTPLKALVLFVNQVPEGTGSNALVFTGRNLNWSELNLGGLPIVVTADDPGTNFWETIEFKKGVLAFH